MGAFRGGLTFWKFDKNSIDWCCWSFVWGAETTKTSRGDETVRVWNHNWHFCAIERYEQSLVDDFTVLPWQLVLHSWGQEIKQHWASLLSTDSLIDFFTCSENLAVTKSFTPNCLAPCKMNKPTAFSAYFSASGETRGLSQWTEI